MDIYSYIGGVFNLDLVVDGGERVGWLGRFFEVVNV